MPSEQQKAMKLKLHRMLDYYFGPAQLDQNKAARMAGYSEKYVRKQSYLLFQREDVKKEIARRQARIAKRFEVTYDRTITELAKVAYANLGDYMSIDKDTGVILIEGKDLNELDYEQLAALGEVTTETHTQGKGDDRETVTRVKVKLHNKLTALDMLMRHSGQSKEKQPLDGAVSLIDRILAGRERTRAREKDDDES